jgi:DNA-binding transcriptional LysR family regulator
VDFRRIDLNLLVTLQALLEERSVTRAARRLGMSQPAASRALGRLRALFADALLVDGPGGYFLSARAEDVRPMLRSTSEEFGARISCPLAPRGEGTSTTTALAALSHRNVRAPNFLTQSD